MSRSCKSIFVALYEHSAILTSTVDEGLGCTAIGGGVSSHRCRDFGMRVVPMVQGLTGAT